MRISSPPRALEFLRKLALFPILGVLVMGTLVAPAAGSQLESDIELGPATRYFATPEVVPGLDGLPPFGRSSGGGGDKEKGNGNGNGGEEEGGSGSGSGSGSTSGGGTTDPENCWEWRPSEFGFLERLNNARTSRDRQPVRLDRELSRVARKHTWEMIERKTLYHTPEDALRSRVTKWLILGENVGRGGTVDSLFRAFMESEPHRENFLYRPFNHVGVGAMHDGNGMLWVTILLEAYEDPGTTLSMPPLCN